MFTGIIEEIGKIQSITSNKISILALAVTKDTNIGDSIAVNGVCLTVAKINADGFDADISPETMRVTTLGGLKAGSFVNLERAMALNGRFGGHIVSGHIDNTGKIYSIKKEYNFYNITIVLPEKCTRYVVKKGSVAVDGISLTVAEIQDDRITIAVIPHTYENTNLKYLQIGDYVNIETDILAKYVEKFLSTGDNKSGISMEFLLENGF